MKVLINGRTWQDIKEANNFTELLLYLRKELNNKAGRIVYWDYKQGLLIEGKNKENKNVSFLVETEEQATNRIKGGKGYERIINK